MATDLSKEQLLGELGLSKNDSKVYLTLLKDGPNTVTVISKKSGVHRANVYGTLERLKVKGLVSEYVEQMKRIFRGAEPSILITLLQEKELKLKALLPQFMLEHQLSQKNSVVEVYESISAIRNIFQHYLDLRENIYAFGIPKIAIDLVGDYFQNVIHKKRAQQKQWMYHLYNSNAVERIKFLNTLPYTEARYLDTEFNSPVATVICGDELSIMSLNADKCILVVIRIKEMAEIYQKYFQVLWAKAQK